MRRLCLIFLALVLAGCGSLPESGSAPTTTASSGPTRARSQDHLAYLQAGWNAVGFECSVLTELSAPASVAGLCWFDGQRYQTGAVTAETVTTAGCWRGFWVYATEAAVLRYTGVTMEPSLPLNAGWSLVAFSQSVKVADLECRLPGRTAPLSDYLLPTFAAVKGTSVSAEGTLQTGACYWVYSREAITLGLRPCPAPSPSPTPTPTRSATPEPSPEASASATPSPTPGPGYFAPEPTPASGHTLRFPAVPVQVTAGQPFVVQLEAYRDNVLDPNYGAEVALGVLGAPANQQQPANQSFSIVLTKPGRVRLFARDDQSEALSTEIEVVPGPASRLVFARQPGGSVLDVAVQVTDDYDNPVAPGAPLTVTLSGGDLSGAQALTDAEGLARFPNLIQNEPGPHELTATAPGLTPAVSDTY